jgi:HD superfamily phosphohydrolase
MSARPKLFRDPVHDIIAFDQNDPIERALFELVNAPEVQRLRRIRQLGMTFLVYHGAEHSRFTHSLGVCHLALRIHRHLIGPRRADLDALALGAAALLHDVGHGAFSHVMERISGVHHEVHSLAVLADPASQVHQVLRAVDPALPDRIARILTHDEDEAVLSALVSSQLDADRMDYILRDRLATGVKIGTYDLARIIAMMELTGEGLIVRDRALEAVEGYLIARFHMYKQVYLHKATRSAERMLEGAFRRARELCAQGYTFEWDPAPDGLRRLLRAETPTVAEHLELDDYDVWLALKRWSREADPILARLAGGILDRRLYKTVDIDPADPRGSRGAIADARDAAQKAGFDPEHDVLVDRSSETPYTPYQPGLTSRPIRMSDTHGRVFAIENLSPIVRLLGESTHETTRLCVPAELRDRIVRVAGIAGAPRLV